MAAQAATLTESSVPGGAFGNAWNNLTTVDAGYDRISGTGSQNQFDNFVFTLPSGSQSLTFDFTAPSSFDYSYSAGGKILYSTTPFKWGWDGTYAENPIEIDYYKPSQSFTLDLADFAGGSLYLALNFTHGNLSYNVSVPGNALPAQPVTPTPAPVPLPAGLVLLGTGIAALGGMAARRRRSAAAA